MPSALQSRGYALALRATLLLTRPAEQSHRFAGDVRARFGDIWPIVISPLTDLLFLNAPVGLEGVGALVFTSETAVAAFVRLSERRDIPAWAIGPRTAEAALRAGFSVRTGPGDGAGLAQVMLTARPKGRAIHLRGKQAAFPLAKLLNSAGIETIQTIVYDRPLLRLTDEARAALAGGDAVIVPLFSSRAARQFAECAKACEAPILVAAISKAVARSLSPLHPVRRVVATRPDGPAMLEALACFTASDLQG